MAKDKAKAYDIGDILGVKDPADEAEKKTPAKAKKPTTPKKAKGKPASNPAEYKPPKYKEKRDARLQAVIPKRLLKALRAEADNAGVSVNEVVNTLLENGLKKRG